VTPEPLQFEPTEELWSLTAAMCDGAISPQEVERLESLLRADPQTRLFYATYMDLHGRMHWWFRGRHPESPAADRQGPQSSEGAALPPLDSVGLPASAVTAVGDGALLRTQSGLFFPMLNSPLGSFVFSYAAAVVIVGIGIALAWMCHVSDPVVRRRDVAGLDSSPAIERREARGREVVSVARVTSMVEAAWSDANSAPSMQRVLLGAKFALASGFVEITYDTGAKVILEGPCTYKVESNSGGYLERGRLTARVESAVGSRQSAVNNTTPKHKGKNSSSHALPTADCPPPTVFSVRTPTATVTDLGTEFGVEVDPRGATQSHVFRGMVKVCAVDAAGNPRGREQAFGANQSARVEAGSDPKQVIVVTVDAAAARAFADGFVREMPRRETKTLDLADVVAGGDGFGKACDRGINPGNGQIIELFVQVGYTESDGRYHRVEGRPYIDGVFVPKAATAVQLDSAGHTFDELGNSDSRCPRCLWTGVIPAGDKVKLDTIIGGVDYAAPERRPLYISSNLGITFDLEAIRRANPRAKIVAFDALAALAAPSGNADVFVFIDGKRFVQQRLKKRDRSRPIQIALKVGDRFLTLVSADGGNGIAADWIIWSNPRLTLTGYNLGAKDTGSGHTK
jgi:hypothetical protein